MVVEPAVWEHRLLSWAHEALTSPAIDSRIDSEATTGQRLRLLRAHHPYQQPDVLSRLGAAPGENAARRTGTVRFLPFD